MPRDKALFHSSMLASSDLILAFAELTSDPALKGIYATCGCAFYTELIAHSDFSYCFRFDVWDIKARIDRYGLWRLDDVRAYLFVLVRLGKLVLYDHDGQTYAWCKTAHRHQSFQYPTRYVVPLPSWITYHEGSGRNACYKWDYKRYERDRDGRDVAKAAKLLGIGEGHPVFGRMAGLFDEEEA